MSERAHYPAGVPCWVDCTQRDPAAGTAFYGALFGWEFAGPGPGPSGDYFVARLGGRDVAGIGALPDVLGPVPPSWNTYVRVKDADAAVRRAREAGATVLLEPLDAAPAGRLAVLLDPAGAPLCLWEPAAREGAQRVNEPGTWAMSALHVEDRAAAARFYGAVFGWRTETAGAPPAAPTLFRLEGYEGEPQQAIPRDVVAVLAPAAPTGGPPVPPHWNVNFAVADPDAFAQRAAELGGAVLVPPFDTPGFRNAVLADPQGAVFSISRPGPRAVGS